MKRCVFLVLIFLILTRSGIFGQASVYTHAKVVDSLVGLFNQQRFPQMYQLTSAEFRKTISEQQLVDLFQNGLYAIYGKVEQWKLLSDASSPLVYLLQFQKEKVQLKIAVQENKQISYLELLPYSEEPGSKRLTYYSDNARRSSLDTVVDAAVRSYLQSPQNCGLSIAVAWKDQVYFYNYGRPQRTTSDSCTSATIYEIGSISKTFCGFLLAQAVVEGKLSLNDELKNFLPGSYKNLGWPDSPVRIKHLANHSSGLPRIPENMSEQPGFDALNPYKHYSKEQLLEYLRTLKPETEPGKVVSYSNLGIAVLSLVLEEVYAQPFAQLVEEKICQPYRLRSTAIVLTQEQQARMAQGYNELGEPTPAWELGPFAAAGGVRSTTGDMIRYLQMNLEPGNKAASLSHQLSIQDRPSLGLTWFISKTKNGQELLWHNGGTYGSRSFAALLKQKQCAVVVLSNSAMDVDYIGIAILDFIQAQ